MTERSPVGSVDPNQVEAAFVLVVERSPPGAGGIRYIVDQGIVLWAQIRHQINADPQITTDLLRRACAMSNFFSDAASRERFGIDESLPPREIWCGAAAAPVHQRIVEGLAWDTFDAEEFAAALQPET
jgi:hypothetical protein